MQGSEHNIQFFMIVQFPVDQMMSTSQFVPQKVALTSTTMATNDVCPLCKKTILTTWKYCPECGCRVSCGSCGNRVGERRCSILQSKKDNSRNDNRAKQARTQQSQRSIVKP